VEKDNTKSLGPCREFELSRAPLDDLSGLNRSSTWHNQKIMRRKRLQNTADTLCQMFCGWRLVQSKPTLVELGSGSLEIDVVTGQCLFHGTPILQIPIAEELRTWMHKDLQTHKIPTTELTHARLAVKLTFSRVPWNKRSKEIFYIDGKPIRSEQMYHCIFECESEIATDGAAHRSSLREIQGWPIGWPRS
jgi:hypothetical protein